MSEQKQVLERAAGVSGAPAVSKEDVPPEMSATEKQKLTELLRQRDDEISILHVSMVMCSTALYATTSCVLVYYVGFIK